MKDYYTGRAFNCIRGGRGSHTVRAGQHMGRKAAHSGLWGARGCGAREYTGGGTVVHY